MKRNLFFVIILLSICFFPIHNTFAQIILPNPLTTTNFTDLISGITTWIASIIGGLSALMYTWSGVLFLTSTGNESRISQAKKVAWYATIGLAVALSGAGLVELLKYIIGVNPPAGP